MIRRAAGNRASSASSNVGSRNATKEDPGHQAGQDSQPPNSFSEKPRSWPRALRGPEATPLQDAPIEVSATKPMRHPRVRLGQVSTRHEGFVFHDLPRGPHASGSVECRRRVEGSQIILTLPWKTRRCALTSKFGPSADFYSNPVTYWIRNSDLLQLKQPTTSLKNGIRLTRVSTDGR